jgi:hypothetical protein
MVSPSAAARDMSQVIGAPAASGAASGRPRGRAIRGGSDDVPRVTAAQVTDALRNVIDPRNDGARRGRSMSGAFSGL